MLVSRDVIFTEEEMPLLIKQASASSSTLSGGYGGHLEVEFEDFITTEQMETVEAGGVMGSGQQSSHPQEE